MQRQADAAEDWETKENEASSSAICLQVLIITIDIATMIIVPPSASDRTRRIADFRESRKTDRCTGDQYELESKES